MSKSLPESANLEHLKNQAKTLLRSLRAQDPAALQRLSDLSSAPFRLAHAQLVIAREYGFESWSKLKRHVVGFSSRRDALFSAIRSGDRDRVSAILTEDRLLARSKDPKSFGSSIINAAASRNDIPMIDLLLSFGVDIDERSDWSLGSFGAMDSANDEVSAYLLSRGATLTPHAAARLGMAAQLKEMLDSDKSILTQRGGDGQFPLHFAKTPEIVDILVDAGADLDARDLDHEGTAAQWRLLNKPVLQRLVERGATQDVYTAVALDDVEALRSILESDPESMHRVPDDPGNPWLPQAPGLHIYVYIIGRSLPHQVASDLKSRLAYDLLFDLANAPTRLAMACWAGNRSAAEKVLQDSPNAFAEMASYDKRMLADVGLRRNLDSVRWMLELGFDINSRGVFGASAIGCSSLYGYDDVVETMLPFNPDLTLTNDYGGTPLTACAYGSVNFKGDNRNFARCVELLIAAGSPLPEKAYGSEEVREILRKHGLPDEQ